MEIAYALFVWVWHESAAGEEERHLLHLVPCRARINMQPHLGFFHPSPNPACDLLPDDIARLPERPGHSWANSAAPPFLICDHLVLG